MCTGRNARARHAERGLTLVELVISLVIISVAVVGILQVLNLTTQRSADPQMRKQAIAIAEALLEEVRLAQFTFCDPVDANVTTAGNPAGCATAAGAERAGPEAGNARPFDNVNDYVTQFNVAQPAFNNGAGQLVDAAGNPIQPTGVYSATLMLTPESLGPAGAEIGSALDPLDPANTTGVNALRITVTVSYGDENVALEAYRTRYDPHFVP